MRIIIYRNPLSFMQKLISPSYSGPRSIYQDMPKLDLVDIGADFLSYRMKADHDSAAALLAPDCTLTNPKVSIKGTKEIKAWWIENQEKKERFDPHFEDHYELDPSESNCIVIKGKRAYTYCSVNQHINTTTLL